MTDWWAQYTGTVLVVGGSVVVAIITVALPIWAKNHTPQAPPPLPDVWGENRTLKGEIRDLENAFDVAFQWIQLAIRNVSDGKPLPEFSDEEKATIGKIRRAPDTRNQ